MLFMRSRLFYLPSILTLASSLFVKGMSTTSTVVHHKKPIEILLGTMTYGSQTDIVDAEEQLNMFINQGGIRIDTARMYNKGKTEEIIGSILEKNPVISQKLFIDSKVNPFKGFNENLTPENVMKQAENIQNALKCDRLNVFYLHAPDHTTPIEETLQAVQTLYEMGRFYKLGLSNYASWEVVYIWSYMQSKGWVLPTVYQGMYNSLTRQVESELFPALKKLNISFIAYNPLCGGLLTGKHKYEHNELSTGTRFDESNKMYLERYWNKEYFHAVDHIKHACDKEESMNIVDASLKWLLYHSQLDGNKGDGIILGGSSILHLKQNLASCYDQDETKQQLPAIVLEAFDHAWTLTKPVCASYFR